MSGNIHAYLVPGAPPAAAAPAGGGASAASPSSSMAGSSTTAASSSAAEATPRMVWWCRKEGIMVKESEFGGELCKNANKERLAAKAKEGTGPRFYIPAGAKSQGWDFLALDASAKFRLVCLLGKGCELDYTRTEGRPASADKDTNHSTFLARHASKCHKKPEQRETKRVWGSGKPPSAAFVHTGKEALAAAAAAAAPAAGTAAGAGQGRLTEYRLFRPRTDADLRRLDRGLAAMLALANLPDALADNKHFMWFCGELTDGQWTPSSRRTVGRHMVDMGNNVIMSLQNLFKRNGPKTYYALQCDIWSSRAGDSYMGHLLTYADADFKTYQIATGCDFMPGSHDMVGVDKVLTKTLHDLYSVPKDQMMAAVHDNGANVVAGVRRLDYPLNVRCTGHTCQLTVNDAVYGRKGWNDGGIPEIVAALKTASQLTAYINYSNKAAQALAACCGMVGIKSLKVQPSIDVRWHSELIMLAVLIRLEPALVKAFELGEGHGGLRRGNKTKADAYFINDWLLLKQVVVVLSMVFNVTKGLESSSNITLSKAMVQLNKLDRALAAPGVDGAACIVEELRGRKWDDDAVLEPVRKLKGLLRKSLQERFPLVNMKHPVQQMSQADQAAVRPFLLAMALDPFIDASFAALSPQWAMEAMESCDAERKEWGVRNLGHSLGWITMAAKEVAVDEIVKMKLRAGDGWSCIDLTDGDDEDERAALEDDGLVDLPDSVLDLLASTSSVGAAGAAGTAGAAGEPGEKAAANAQAMEDMRRVVSDQFERFQTKECAFQALKKVHKANNRNTSVRWNNPVTTRTKEWEAAGGWKLGRGPEMDWWYRNQHNYPDVALLARAVLSIPANSAGAERMFNGTGQTVNPYRSKLTPDNVRIRTLVRENFFPGLLDTKNYSANQSFVGKRRREEGGAGEGAGGGKEGNGVDGSDGVLDFLPPVAPRCPVEGGGETEQEADEERSGTEFSEAVRMQYSRGDISRDVVAAMGQSAASIVASSTYYSAYSLDTVYVDALAILAEAAAAQTEA